MYLFKGFGLFRYHCTVFGIEYVARAAHEVIVFLKYAVLLHRRDGLGYIELSDILIGTDIGIIITSVESECNFIRSIDSGTIVYLLNVDGSLGFLRCRLNLFYGLNLFNLRDIIYSDVALEGAESAVSYIIYTHNHVSSTTCRFASGETLG